MRPRRCSGRQPTRCSIRVFATPYSDARLVSAFVTRGPFQPAAGAVVHAALGAGFGWAFARLGGRGARQAAAVALAEHVAAWPLMLVFDRIHPSRRDGSWPPIFPSGRAFGHATVGHLLFGALLGLLLDGPRASPPVTCP